MGIAACQSDSGGYALDNLFVPKQQNANYTISIPTLRQIARGNTAYTSRSTMIRK